MFCIVLYSLITIITRPISAFEIETIPLAQSVLEYDFILNEKHSLEDKT